MRLSVGHHERIPTGVTVSRLTSDIEALRQLVTDGITTLVVQGLTFVGVIVILFSYDWQLALVAFAIFPFLARGDRGVPRDLGGRVPAHPREGRERPRGPSGDDLGDPRGPGLRAAGAGRRGVPRGQRRVPRSEHADHPDLVRRTSPPSSS